jgi:hypothetical protein
VSWDIDLVSWPGTVDGMLKAFASKGLPTVALVQAIRAQVTAIWPTVSWSGPLWGSVCTDKNWIEFQLDDGESLTTVTLHIRGGGDPLPEIAVLAKALKVQALDRTTMKFLDLNNPSRDGWRSWSRWAKGIDPLETKPNA